MANIINAVDAIATLNRSSLPTVITEGTDDYRVMRKMEQRLADCGVDFLPLSGRDMVLEVWHSLNLDRKSRTIALVDLDCWLYKGIPINHRADNILYTLGYSIENDLFLDSMLFDLLDADEVSAFHDDLKIVASRHAREIERALCGDTPHLAIHPNSLIEFGSIQAALNDAEMRHFELLVSRYGQCLRGKTLFDLLLRQLSRSNRWVRFSKKQLYEMGSANMGEIFQSLEQRIRLRICPCIND